MPYAILVDLRKCIGDRACQVACKRWHDLPGEPTKLSPEWTNPPDLGPNTWTHIRFVFNRNEEKDAGVWRFVKWQCMHCEEPTCAAVCPTRALHKTKEGPVLYDEDRCIGCRYCVTACPFSVPKFDWQKMRMIRKCTMCSDRIAVGLKPACVSSCPTGALSFDELDEVIKKADKAQAAGAYVYGRREVGGTSVIYISDIPFDALRFPRYGPEPPSVFTNDLLLKFAAIGVGGVALLFGLKRFSERRKKIEEEK